MDYTAIGAAIVSGLLSIGAIATFFKLWSPKISKYAMVAKDAVETLADVSAALSDGTLSAEEIVKLKADVAAFRADLAR